MNKNLLKLNTVEQNVWFSSDFHGFHRNICRGTSTWDGRNTRDFDTVEEMTQHILDNINKYVQSNDYLFFLGDWTFGGFENIKIFREQIKCENIVLMYGNHDEHQKANKMFSDGTFSKDLFKECHEYLEIYVDKQMLCLFHYPIESHNHNNKTDTAYHLHGHTHSTLNPLRRNRIDVGIDNIFKLTGEYKPVSFKEVMELINTQNNQLTV